MADYISIVEFWTKILNNKKIEVWVPNLGGPIQWAVKMSGTEEATPSCRFHSRKFLRALLKTVGKAAAIYRPTSVFLNLCTTQEVNKQAVKTWTLHDMGSLALSVHAKSQY